ncbi:hypothetical protein D9753_23335 [Streptomyces dangxiongensis]|uniref:Uncharacterized protein n=1 Tax=Streptomyces dangxiongensis TaxID=1442032 RepID=A0A3G2JG27_9ACTN|nr:hypothetical protein [Streptomyces dangxiongensis]AYN41323.1 hypothetical protein D9753_23335 [Streptomyces dangxiongensis]
MTSATARQRRVRAPHPLRTEGVRGFAPWAGAAVLLTCGAMLSGTAGRWQGGWSETAVQVHTALLITVPLAAAAGCWQGGRERRRRTEELWATTVRTPLARLLLAALPVAFWVVAGYLLTVAAAFLATWPYAQGDRPHLALLPGDSAAVAAGALAGHVVGRAVPTRLAAPLLAMTGYVGLGVMTAGGSSAGRALSPAALAGVGELPVWWQPWAMAVWTGGLACAAALGYAARRRAVALLPLAAALAAGTLLAQSGDALWYPDPLTRRQVCDTSRTPAVCVNARYAGMLPQVSDALSGVTDKLRGVRDLPVRWADHGDAPHADEAALPAVTPLGWSAVRGRLTDPQEYAWEAVGALALRGDCPEEQESDRVLTADDAVEHYLAPSPVRDRLDGSDAQDAWLRRAVAARARLAGMDGHERRAWLSAYFAARADCRTKEIPAL